MNIQLSLLPGCVMLTLKRSVELLTKSCQICEIVAVYGYCEFRENVCEVFLNDDVYVRRAD